MRCIAVFALVLLLSPLAPSQTSDSNRAPVTLLPNPPTPQAQPPAAQTQQPPSYANYSIMLVSPILGGGAVALMHNPKNELEFVDVNKTKDAFAAGYVPVRAVELGEFIAALKEDNARLTAENARLQGLPINQIATSPAPATPSRSDIEVQQRAQIEAQKAARRQQLIQSWMMLQNMNRPQTFNVNVTDCTRYPALCAGR